MRVAVVASAGDASAPRPSTGSRRWLGAVAHSASTVRLTSRSLISSAGVADLGYRGDLDAAGENSSSPRKDCGSGLWRGTNGLAGPTADRTVKHGLLGLVRALAEVLSGTGVTATAGSPDRWCTANARGTASLSDLCPSFAGEGSFPSPPMALSRTLWACGQRKVSSSFATWRPGSGATSALVGWGGLLACSLSPWAMLK